MRVRLLSLILLIACKTVFAFNAIDAIGVMTAGTEPAAAEGKVSSCGQNLMNAPKICEAGAGFLCLNTPDLSTVEENIILRGTIDIKNNALSSLTASIQNEYSNEFKQISFTKPKETADCRNSTSDYCLDSAGYFSINVPLGSKYGPYTIVVTATRANGAPAKEKIRTSRAVEPKISVSDIKIVPSQNNAQITINLLHSCQACDFFGIATGGLQITATNIINGPDGSVKKTTVKTNAASGGIYSFCIPVESGSNNVTINACNGATGYKTDKCPTIQLAPFSADDAGKSGLIWEKPPEKIYAADTNPTVDITFKLGAAANQSCEESNVKLLFNRNAEQKICSDADGYYRLSLEPETGINIGTIKDGDKKYPFTFGWGEIASPFAADGKVRENEDLAIKTAGGFSVGKSFLTQISRSILNNYLKSDEFKELLSKLPQILEKNEGAEQDAAVKEEIESIRNEIPQCRSSSSGEEKNYGVKLTREPVIELIDIPRVEFKQDAINFTLNAENVKIWASVFLDQDEDGAPDKKMMPLKIAFRKIFAPIEIKVDRSGENPRFILTGPSTDCEYKSKHACNNKKPAILVPKDFFGSATEGGSFVRCDDDVEDACKGVNLINAQTGLVSMTILDAINDKLYCDGSAALTYLIREKIKSLPIQIGCPQNKGPLDPIISLGKCDGIFSDRGWVVPIGLDLLSNQFGVGENGIWGDVPALVGNKEYYSQFSEDLKSPETGYIKKPYLASQPVLASSEITNFGIALGEDFINAILFALSEQNHNAGLFDWDIDDQFLKRLGFDAVKECDE
ncbi:MAG: hypothetical protein HYT75_04835, partial [Deltaproteobacteria bacterium]|nr:hypothetical protein [Deltaproteobacteria bacterium]